MVGLSVPVQCKCLREGWASGRAGKGKGPWPLLLIISLMAVIFIWIIRPRASRLYLSLN